MRLLQGPQLKAYRGGARGAEAETAETKLLR